MSAPAATLDMAGSAGADSTYAAGPLSQDRLVRQEVALGLIRELVPDQTLIGLNYFPMKDVPADDVVFYYAQAASTGLAPARADDAEAELFQQDEFAPGEGRARLIDWALKSRYQTSAVNTHRSFLRAAEKLRDGSFDATISNLVEEFRGKVSDDTIKRRERLDLRLNWLAMQSLVEGSIVYNDGKIKFSIDWGRPADQHRIAPLSGTYAADTHDPINDIRAIKTLARKRYGVEIREAICSQDWLDTFWKARMFALRTGVVGATNAEIPYLLSGWGPGSAIAIVEQETGIKFTVHDSVYRTRAIGSTNTVNNRWLPRDEVIFLPGEEEINAYDDTGLGFGKTLTSPHPMGNWTSGYYEWERERIDPWVYEVGTGIKALPIMPHADLTFNVKFALPPV